MSRVTSNQSDKNSSNKSYANRNLNDALKPQPQSLSQSGNRPGTFVPLVNNRRTAAKPSIVSPLGPVNTPSLKRENNGKDMFVNLVSSSGPSVWKAGSDSSGGSGNPQPAATAEAPVQSAPKPSWQNSPSATSSILNSSSSTAAASNTTTSSSSVPLPLPKSMPKQTNWADMDSDEEDDVGDYTLPLPAQPTHDPVNQAQTQAPPQSQPVYNQPSNVTVVPKPFAGQSQGGYNRLVGGQNSNFNQQYNNRQPYNSHFRDNRDRNESRERSGSSDYSSNGRWGSSGRDYNHSGPRDYNRGNFDRGDRDYHNDVYNSPPLSSTATGGEHTLEEQEALGASRRAYEQAKLLREQQQQREREAQREREMHKECDGQMDRDHRFYNEHQDRDRGEVGGFRGHHPPSQHGNNQMNQSQGHPGRRGYDRFDKPAPPVYDRHGHSRGPSSGYGPSSNGTADSGQWERSQSLPPPPPGVKISNSNFKENREREGGVTDHKQKNELRNQGQHQEEPDDYDSLVPSANVNSNKSYASLFPKQSSEQQGRENDSAAAPVDSEWSRNVGRRNDVDNVKMLYVPRMGKYVESSAALAAEKGARPHRRARSSTEDSSSSGPVPTAIMRRSDDKKAKLFNEKREEPRQSAYVSEKVKQAEIRRDIRLKIKKLLNKPHSNGVLYGYNPDSETRTLNDIVYVAGNKAMCAKNSVKNERVEKSNKAKAVTPSSTSTSGNSNAVSPSKKASVGRDSNAGEEAVTKESPNDQDSATGTPAKHIKDAKKMDTMDDNFDILSEMAAMSLHDDAAYAPSGDGHDMLDITQLAEQREYMYDTSCSSFVPGMLHGGVNKNSESDVEWSLNYNQNQTNSNSSMSNSSSSDDSLMLMSRIFSTNTNSVGVGPSDSESGLQWQIPKFIEEDEGVTRYGPTTSHTNRKNDDQGLTASLLYENSTPSLHSSSYPESRKKAPSALAVLVAEGVSGSRVAPRPTEAHIYAQNQVQMPLQTHPAASIVSSIVENSMGLYDMGTNTNDMGVEGSVAPSSTHNSNSGSQSQAVPAEPLEHVDSPVDVAVAKASVEETAPGGRGGRGRGGRGRGRGAADGRSLRGGRGRGDRLNTSAEGKDEGGKGRAVKEGPGAPKPSPASVPTSSASMGAQTAVAAKAPKVKQQKAKPKEEIENAPVSAAPTDESNDEKGRGGKGKSRRGKIGSVVSGSDTSENVVQSDAIATKHKPNSTQKVRKPVPEDGAPVDIIVSTTKRVIPPSRAERADLSGPPVRPVAVEEAATGGRGGRGRGRGRGTVEGRSGRGGRGRGDRLSTTAKGKSDNGPPANPK